MKTFTSLLLLLAIVFLLWLPYAAFNLGPVSDDQKIQEFSIEKGESLDMIAGQLEQQDLIRSKRMFKLYALFKGTAHQLKPGLYLIAQSNTAAEILEKFIEGPDNEVTVLIPEGQTVDQIDERLAQLGLIKSGDISNFPIDQLTQDYPFLRDVTRLEGFMFPDTYKFTLDLEPAQIIARFLTNFEEKALDSLQSSADPYATLIIASMLEKEIPETADRKLVAGLIQNRLDIGMALHLDATLIYAKDHGSAYDTYEFPGLPPTPIANPGLDAIESALSPEPSSYFYYLSHPETRETLFSETFDEHDTKRGLYINR